jgi:hypothetical protein
METPVMIAAAAMLLWTAAYAQLRIARYTASARAAAATRALLAAVGIAFGYVCVRIAGSIAPALVFATAFGIVHVPAAIILFLKREQHAGPS